MVRVYPVNWFRASDCGSLALGCQLPGHRIVDPGATPSEVGEVVFYVGVRDAWGLGFRFG